MNAQVMMAMTSLRVDLAHVQTRLGRSPVTARLLDTQGLPVVRVSPLDRNSDFTL